MDLASYTRGKMDDVVVLTLTRKDLVFLILVLEAEARSRAIGGSLLRDIKNLQARMGRYWSTTGHCGGKPGEGAVKGG